MRSYTDRLLDTMCFDEWKDAITAQIDALPYTIADIGDPYLVGCIDAEAGMPCEPLGQYAKLGDIEQYILGWMGTTEAAVEAEDYEADILDREWHSRGMW